MHKKKEGRNEENEIVVEKETKEKKEREIGDDKEDS